MSSLGYHDGSIASYRGYEHPTPYFESWLAIFFYKNDVFTLFGYGKVAFLLIFSIVTIMTTTEVKYPSWASLNGVEENAVIRNIKEVLPMIMCFTATILTPPFLTASIINLESYSAYKVFLKVIKAT